MEAIRLRGLRVALAARRRRLRRRARRALARPHRTIVVPLLGSAESEHALDLACRTAADRRSHVLLLAPLFVEAELPLGAHMHDEERDLHEELVRTRALAESYGIGVRTRIVRARHGQLGVAVAEAADEQHATLIVLGAPVESQRGFRQPFSRDVWSVLKDAPCRVMLSTGRPIRGLSGRVAA
jgi:nucleotide-binding universal stress UspA family protein